MWTGRHFCSSFCPAKLSGHILDGYSQVDVSIVSFWLVNTQRIPDSDLRNSLHSVYLTTLLQAALKLNGRIPPMAVLDSSTLCLSDPISDLPFPPILDPTRLFQDLSQDVSPVVHKLKLSTGSVKFCQEWEMLAAYNSAISKKRQLLRAHFSPR